MTNLSADFASPRFSRERILKLTPLLPGLLTAAGLFVLQVLPTNERIAELDSRLQDVYALRQQVPVMRQRLEVVGNQLDQAKVQQALLLELVAGTDRIQTFLALLDQRARTAGVEIQRLEPLQEVSSVDEVQSRQDDSSDQRSSGPMDPLQDLGYRKTSVALDVVGTYDQLHFFLKEMENLEVLVEASDLRLESGSDPGKESDSDDEFDSGVKNKATTNRRKIELSLRFSFYDRSLAKESGTFSTASASEEAPN